MMKCGLLGRTLGHSYSPAIHAKLGTYSYELFEKEPEELEEFLLHGVFHGLNVTIPYKKAVVPYCAELSDTARILGSVNTLVRRSDGSLYGDNTDYSGFAYLVDRSGISVRGKKALVLGSGGASVTVCAVLRQLGARVVVISRRGQDNYDNLQRHADAAVIVNATPVGMFPNCGAAPVDLALFPHLEDVFDLIYNPARTAFLLQAEALGIPGFGGLPMLVGQAKRSSEQFQGVSLPDSLIGQIEHDLRRKMENIVLIGMPGCGKSTVAQALGEALGRPVCDADALVEELAGQPIPEIFATQGEAAFRRLETQALRQLGQRSGIILATGGGCVTRAENYPLLHQNGQIFWLQRALHTLETAGRPLSMGGNMVEMYTKRVDYYTHFADYIVPNDTQIEDVVTAILEVLQ